MRITTLLVAGTIALIPLVASAHEPVYIDTQDRISIPDPTTSRAYYGELTGRPAVYEITLATAMDFYLNILSPDIPGARTDYQAIMRDQNGIAVITLRDTGVWEKWYEDFAGDTYLKGPEIKKSLPAGTYTIEVSNPGNSGKYSLAPGEAEVFTLAGTPHTISEIYQMKTKFFGEPWYAIFEGIIGKFLLGLAVFILFSTGYLLYRFSLRRR